MIDDFSLYVFINKKVEGTKAITIISQSSTFNLFIAVLPIKTLANRD